MVSSRLGLPAGPHGAAPNFGLAISQLGSAETAMDRYAIGLAAELRGTHIRINATT